MAKQDHGCQDGCAYYAFSSKFDSDHNIFYCKWYLRKTTERTRCPYFKDDGIDEVILELSGYYDNQEKPEDPL